MNFNAITMVCAFLKATVVMDLQIVHWIGMNQNNFALQIGFNPMVHINFTLWLKYLYHYASYKDDLFCKSVVVFLFIFMFFLDSYYLPGTSDPVLLNNGIYVLLTIMFHVMFPHGYEMS